MNMTQTALMSATSEEDRVGDREERPCPWYTVGEEAATSKLVW